MIRAPLFAAVIALAGLSCRDASTTPAPFEGTYALAEENGQVLPSDPSAPYGCCITLSGSVIFTASTYDLRTSHRNKNNGLIFENSEQGTYTRSGSTVSFARSGGGGAGFPYLLAPATVSGDGTSVTLLYGDEGPGSNQIRATFRR